jgi:uncharacterized protein (TIGR02996 family)
LHDEQDFLRAIIANPNEDAPRLVFADWLEESGQQRRACAIRAQIEAHRMEPHLMDALESRIPGLQRYEPAQGGGEARWMNLMAEASAVTSDPELNGLSPLLAGLAADESVIWARGFVECVICDAGFWVERGDDVLAEQPVTQVRLTSIPQFRTDGADRFVWLEGDPTERRFAWADLESVDIAGAHSLDAQTLIGLQLFALRWPGVDVEIEE